MTNTCRDTGICLSDPGVSENEKTICSFTPELSKQSQKIPHSSFTPGNKTNKTCEKVKNNCLKGKTVPLPGILDHRDFRRSPVCLGKCYLCNEGSATYHSDEQRASICEGWYSRLVREWNRNEGVGMIKRGVNSRSFEPDNGIWIRNI